MRVEKSFKPLKSNSKAARCLQVLLDGRSLNRKNLGELGIAHNNDSAHSLISILRNEQLIPIESKRISDETCDYYMKPEEITRFKNTILREQQKSEMKALVEEKRINHACTLFLKLLDKLNSSSEAWRCVPALSITLKVILEGINASLEKGVNY